MTCVKQAQAPPTNPLYQILGAAACCNCEGDTKQRPRNYADPAQTTYITAGVLRFGIEYRRLQNDHGICIHVFRGPDDRQDEVLRFDCFARQPHYHYAWSKNDRYMPAVSRATIFSTFHRTTW